MREADAAPGAGPEPVRILMDNDTGIDDALALAYLAACPHVDLVAVTSSPGNVGTAQVAANNRALLALCGRAGVPVLTGAETPLQLRLVTTPETHGPQGLGHAVLDPVPPPQAGPGAVPGDAVARWVEAARAEPGRLTALLTGPLTNFALALRAEPRLPWLFKRVVIMGGAFYHQGNTTPTAEWNTHVDPHAAREVHAAYARAAEEGLDPDRLPVLCPLDATERFEMRPAFLAELAREAGCPEPEHVADGQPDGLPSRAANPLVRHLSDALRFYFEFHRDYDQGYIAHVHDLFAAGVAAGTMAYRTRPAAVDVETESSLLLGTTVADFRGLWGRAPHAHVVEWNDPEAGFADAFRRLGLLARRIDGTRPDRSRIG
ncbi:nucleoside hydrolase [Zafaria sp. J156]|uniref:nucleoside hydrolase n=1 Tax=Zafaria sp. J156 TaxID=3116490 RepID=UPI002E79E1E4|nr:nucleoside hydrolase [Zafaria sp. J156]MEE1620117.1 nucleoside hydrolase [Zafaria sp. J156]